MKSKTKKLRKKQQKQQQQKKITPPPQEPAAVNVADTAKPPQFPFLLRRFVEFLICSLICSIPLALLYATGIIPKTDKLALQLMGASLFVFVVMNIYLLRAFYYSMGNRRIYFNVNLLSYLIFAAVNIICLLSFSDNTLPSLYSNIFMPFKFATVILKTIGLNTANMSVHILAPIATHVLMYILIVAAPLEMYTFDKPKKK